MNIKAIFSVCAVGAVLFSSATLAAEEGGAKRTIHILQDDAQTKFVTKVYELKHITPPEIKPYLIGAVTRYDANSTVQVVAAQGGEQPRRIMVTTGIDVIDMVDQIVETLDRPGRKDAVGSIIDGTGVNRVAYTPQYRAAKELAPILYNFIGTAITKAYVNTPTNTVFWLDDPSGVVFDLEWLKYLDRPLPQAMIRFNCYEFRESTLRDIGFDYLAWKNGPGVNLFNVGYNAGQFAVDEFFTSIMTASEIGADLAAGWGYGGFFTAPQFDMSFIRCLQQSGTANISSDSTLTLVNTPVRTMKDYEELNTNPVKYQITLNPQYQNLSRNIDGRSVVGHLEEYKVHLMVINPIINLAEKSSKASDQSMPPARGREAGRDGTVVFDYVIEKLGVVERGNTGNSLGANTIVSGSMTLGLNHEKIIAVYDQENEIEQSIGLQFLSEIPILGYLFSTKTSVKEHSYRVVTAEAIPLNIVEPAPVRFSSRSNRFDTTGKFGNSTEAAGNPSGEQGNESGK